MSVILECNNCDRQTKPSMRYYKMWRRISHEFYLCPKGLRSYNKELNALIKKYGFEVEEEEK